MPPEHSPRSHGSSALSSATRHHAARWAPQPPRAWLVGRSPRGPTGGKVGFLLVAQLAVVGGGWRRLAAAA
ncbi:Os02g0161050 [Oryza sativa Japonica Group]|uniref:Os02g0161050 protein n=1 Tax=Oryza sativa subsp. japonica TaxID=39947 RepID=A0A0P0VF14_ORYSJ|nr:hypothetical protein EE612_009014 [Oryza sativa]BAS77109.1 Os02g0161050 [Oryza sativa Japonica Group]